MSVNAMSAAQLRVLRAAVSDGPHVVTRRTARTVSALVYLGYMERTNDRDWCVVAGGVYRASGKAHEMLRESTS